MKKVLRLLAAVATVAFIYSCEDPVDTDAIPVNSVPPRLASSQPANNALIKIETEFDIKGFWTDGPLSPLANGSIQLLDASNNVVNELSETLSGTSDSIVWEGSVFGAAGLAEGDYKIVFTATDSQNGVVRDTTAFKIFASLYSANHAAIFIAGNFNGWGGAADETGDAFELISDNTWERKNVVMDGGGWKLRNTTDWSDEDWGDGGCTGVMVSSSAGNDNTTCWSAGTYDIVFNDETLVYTMTNQNPPDQRIDDLYIVGTFNDFTGNDESRFELASDNTWELEYILRPNDAFKFSEAADLRQRIWGDNEGDGIADLYGASIKLASDAQEGYYLISFIDNTFEYSVEYVRGLFPSDLFLVGGSTVAGWDNGAAFQFEKLEDGKFRTYQYLTTDGDGFKFLPQQGSWDGDLGMVPGSPGSLTADGEDNVTVPSDGFYRIDVDFTSSSYSVTASNWGVIGDATPGGWDNDTDMTLVSATKGNFSWSITWTATDGFIKFRENDGWDINYGLGSAAGSLGFNSSDNIPLTAGARTVTMTLDSKNGYTYTIE